jgi:hypothetical protein
MRTGATLVLLVSKSRGRVDLCVAVVVSRNGRLGRWGIAVISSRRGSGVRIWAPLIHGAVRAALCGRASKAIALHAGLSTVGRGREGAGASWRGGADSQSEGNE